jgi:hypothetical protein
VLRMELLLSVRLDVDAVSVDDPADAAELSLDVRRDRD